MTGTVDAIREWFRTYKIPDGKPENKFGLKGKCMDAAYAMKVIDETHHAWYVRAVRAHLLILILVLTIIIFS
jgi:inorganic pyrophosphatase